MVAIGKGSTTDVSNPRLVFYAQDDGLLVDLYSLSFQIFDLTSEEKRQQPVQIYPTTSGDKQPVDLDADRLGLGRYAPSWTTSASVGRHSVKWFWKLKAASAEARATQVFDVLNGEPLDGPAYALVSDLRTQCEDGAGVSESRLQMSILQASSFVQNITARFFEPRFSVQRHDGNGSRALLLKDPVIAVEPMSLIRRSSPTDLEPIEMSSLRVFNRHVSQRLTNPDDRDNPKIEFIHGRDRFQPEAYWDLGCGTYFPSGVQNVVVPGVFGFTEWDGTPFGKTPEMIQYVTRLIALREMPTDDQCRSEVRNGWRVVEERTRDQFVKYADPRKFGQWTGDADIDSILASYVRVVNLGSA